ncbi:MAG: DUF3303 family protein [Acidobacteriota bacterium]|nr:DUF3303 family protein [Acidobacteriota bacterium]
MKFVTTFTIRPGCHQEAVERLLGGKAPLPAGVTLIGRWFKTDGSGGFSVYETDDPSAMFANAVLWSDVLEVQSSAVVEGAVAASALAARYGMPK